MIAALIEFLRNTGSRTLKLGLVGCSFTDKRRINRRIMKAANLPACRSNILAILKRPKPGW